ncbi:MAG: helix-turn-helix domain-containing protein [Mycobacterium sp.]|nr:MAG: helix-turn-helix domain-containing protein [Mycobacterium sp.]
MRRAVPAMLVSPGQREVLESVARSTSAPHREVVRARALLMAADGLANTAFARTLSVSPASVSGWPARFAEEGLVKFAQVREWRGGRRRSSSKRLTRSWI